MSLNVDALCAALDNRLDHRLMFEGKVVRGLHRRESVCRQLYDRWLSMGGKHATYDLFKKSLRFRVNNGWVMASVKYDPTPVIAAGVAGLGLTAAGLGAYQYLKKPKPLISNLPNKNAKPPRTPSPSDPRLDAPDDWRPGVFKHINSSCYFHAAMLMLFQMKDWYHSAVEKTISADELSDEANLLKKLDELLTDMEQYSLLSTQLTTPAYDTVQRILFPAERRNRQQDADIFSALYAIMEPLGIDLKSVTLDRRVKTFEPAVDNEQIKELRFEEQNVGQALVDEFEKKWKTLQGQDRLLENWTMVDGKIVSRTNKRNGTDGFQREISIGGDDNFSPDDVKVDQSTDPEERREPLFPLIVTLLPENGEVCKLVEATFNNGRFVAANKRLDGNLFNSKTKRHESFVYTDLSYCVVLMQLRPNAVPKKFEYCPEISLQGHAYMLTCIIFRVGCGIDSGHYTAGLKIGDAWVYYDDIPPKRKMTTLEALSKAVPFMLLFKKASQPLE